MARRYTRDNRGRFASAGSGATARGGRLKTAGGNKRQTQTMTAKAAPKGTVGKPRGLKPDAAMSSRLKMRDKTSALGKIAQRREFQASMRKVASQITPTPSKPRVKAGRPTGVIKGTDKMNTHAFITKAGQNKAARAQSKAQRAKPAATAQELVNASVRKNQNKKLRSLNTQIKAAGPNAGGLRLEKLALQTRMTSTRPRPSSKQQAKQQASTNALRARVSRMKRAQARIDATADTRNIPGSKMIRRPDAKTSRSNRRAEQARSIYLGASSTSVKNFAKGVARTARAKNNWRPVRSSRPR